MIVFIYGGGFRFSSLNGNEQNYLIDHDLIFVTLNHRHGALGFLSTEDEIVPGNMALKDQAVAIRWVSDNIEHFGGDPKRVTLTGCSTGGASVHYHYLSPMTAGLFQSGISFSGSAFDAHELPKNLRQLSIEFGRALGCPTDDLGFMVQCLKSLPVKTLLEEHTLFTVFSFCD